MTLVLMFWRGLWGYCPQCGQTRMFKGWYRLRDHCPNCGIAYENQPGDFTGAVHVNAIITAGLAMVLGVVSVLAFDLPITVVTLIDLPVVVFVGIVLHRPIKGAWTALMIYTRALEPPDEG